LKRLTSIERSVLPLAMAALNMSWITLWQRWVMTTAHIAHEPSVGPWLMVAAILAGTALTRYAVASAQNNIYLRRAKLVVGLGGLASVVAVLWITFGARFPFQYFRDLTEWRLILAPEALAFVVACLLWWRSIRIGRSDDLHETAQREFFGGITALVVLFVLNKFLPGLDAADSFWYTLSFFALGLGAMAMAGLEQDRRLQKGSTGSGLGVNRHWLATVGGIIGLILAGGTLIAAATAPESLSTFDAWLEMIGVIILTVVGFFVILLAWLVFPIAEAIARVLWALLQRLMNWLPRSMPFRFQPPDFEYLSETAESLARTPTFRFLEILLLMLLAAFLFMLAVRRFKLLASQNDADEVRESILTRELLWKQLLGLLTRRRAGAASEPPFLRLDGPTGDPRLAVRRAYQFMLEWAQSLNRPRSPAQTPLGYARALGSAVPQAREPVAALTELYMRARYSPAVSVEDARRAAAVIEALKRLQTEQPRPPR
jgi:hypothetical protein